MKIRYVEGEGFYAADLDQEESAKYDEGEDGKKEIAAQVLNELGPHASSVSITLYHANGHELYTIVGRPSE
jgi:hypothetical protein